MLAGGHARAWGPSHPSAVTTLARTPYQAHWGPPCVPCVVALRTCGRVRQPRTRIQATYIETNYRYLTQCYSTACSRSQQSRSSDRQHGSYWSLRERRSVERIRAVCVVLVTGTQPIRVRADRCERRPQSCSQNSRQAAGPAHLRTRPMPARLLCAQLTQLTLYVLNLYQRKHRHVFTFHVIPPHWHGTGSWNPSSSKTRT